MAITFPDNLFIGAGNPIDAKYLSATNTAYADVAAVCARIPEAQRYVGLTVLVQSGATNVEYWFHTGTTNLVLKTTTGGGGSGTITGAINGLGVSGTSVCLGGTITTPVVFVDNTGQGLQYDDDYSGTFVERSLVDKGYVDNKFSGTTYHIPVYNALGDGIQDTTLTFSGTTLSNSDNLIIETPLSKDLYLVGKSALSYNSIFLGKPLLSSGVTVQNICVDGLASDISLQLNSKGSTPTSSYILLNAPYVYLGSTAQAGLLYNRVNQILRMPDYGTIHGYDGTSIAPNASPMCIVGGDGYTSGGAGGSLWICGGDAVGSNAGGNVVIEGGSGSTMGNVHICNLPLKTTELHTIYYDTSTGALSYGLATGGTGSGLITGATNGLTVSGMNVKLGGMLTGATFTGGVLKYFADYSGSFDNRTLIDKEYALKLNEKVSKLITASFSVGDVIGFSGGTYNKAIADGTYNGEILGIVTAICGACVELTQAGYTTGLSGLINNKTYFLSDATAGLLTTTEPTTYGHVSKAVLIADTATSGWVLPYAGYVISTGSSENVNGERVSLIVSTAPSPHPFSVNDVIGWSNSGYTKAIANGTYNGEIIGIVTRSIDSNTFEVTQSGYFSGLTTLSPNTTYFVSDGVAGLLTSTKPTTLTHVVRPILATTTANAGWILPYPGYVLISGETSYTATTVAAGLGLTDVAQTFNVNITDIAPVGTEIPVKIDAGGSNILYVDSNDIIGGSTASGERITKSITQANTFAVGDVVGFSGGTYNLAIADGTYDGEVIGIVTKAGNPFELTQAGFVTGLTATSLITSSTYFLSDVVAGQLIDYQPTGDTHIVKAVLLATSSSTGWVLPYAGFAMSTGITSFTGYTFVESGATQITVAGDVVTIYTNPTGTTTTLVGSGNTSVTNISGNTWIIYSPTGGTSSFTGYTFVESGGTQISLVGDVLTIYSPTGGTGGGTWGTITGTLSDQIDLWDEIEYSITGETKSAIDLGGIDVDYVLTGKTISCILKDLLIPELFQTSVGTPMTTVGGASGTYEVGCSLSLTITPTYTSGTITPLYQSTAPYTRGGAANSYQYKGCCLPDTGRIANTSCSVNPYIVSGGTNIWCVRTWYDSGATINGSKGTYNTCPAYAPNPLPSGCTAYGTTSLTGIYPYFYGTGDTAPVAGSALLTTGLKVLASSSSYIDVNFNAIDKYIWLAIPNGTSKTKWVGSNNVTNTETIPGSLFPTKTTTSVNSPSSCWSGVNYDFYISNYKTCTCENNVFYTMRFCN